MGLLSSSGGEQGDSLQIGLAVFAIVISLVVTSLVPAIVPEYDADGDTLADARQKMENFTGESMLTYSPWQLTSIRTPYTANEQVNVISDYGWIYGSIETSYVLDGVEYVGEEVVRYDPSQKSTYPLSQGAIGRADAITTEWQHKDYFEGGIGAILSSPFRYAIDCWNHDTHELVDVVKTGRALDFTGYLYHYDPVYRISTQGSSQTTLNSDMASLNVVWYSNPYGTGVSGGLVLQSDKTNMIIANYSATDIIRTAQNAIDKTTKYLLDFDGVQVYMYVYFDNDVLANGISLEQAWGEGKWQIAFASPSADGLMDIFNSNNLSSSIGSLVDTYVSIYTFNMPNCPTGFNVVFWVLCVLPLALATLFFLSRFGLAGMGAGVLGMGLAYIGLS